jgi:hypothetical protein
MRNCAIILGILSQRLEPRVEQPMKPKILTHKA